MKNNSYFVKSLVGLSLISSVALANDKDIEINDNNKDISLHSSIIVPNDISESQEKGLAHIDVQNVVDIVSQKFKGKIVQVKLENEDDNLLYKAEILEANNQIRDVLIDAGNGKILLSQIDENDDNEPWYKFWE